MTREEAKELLPIIQAWAEGKTIEVKIGGYWNDLVDGPNLLCNAYECRVKPEPKYRPFKTQEECWGEMHKHSDFGWIINAEKYYNICDVTPNGITILYECDPCYFDFESCVEEITFTDGTSFGIKEN